MLCICWNVLFVVYNILVAPARLLGLGLIFLYSDKKFTIDLTVYYTFLLYDSTGTIPRGAKDHDYPMASLKVHKLLN